MMALKRRIPPRRCEGWKRRFTPLPELYGGCLRLCKVVAWMSPDEGKTLRADAARNRSRLLDAATVAFADRGADASLDDIAKAAGLGIGTLYRHFPTREDLVLAVYGAQIDALDQRSRELAASDDPGEALREWMRGFVDFYAVKQGMVTLLRTMMNGSRAGQFEQTRATMREAAERVLAPATAAGVIRRDVAA